jgi:putative oxidoreductase
MTKSDDTGKLVLRVALGILILLHGIAKVGKGVDGIGGMLASHGLPARSSRRCCSSWACSRGRRR